MIHKNVLSLMLTLNKAICEGKQVVNPDNKFTYKTSLHWEIRDISKKPTKIETHYLHINISNKTYYELPQILQFDRDKYPPSEFSKWIKINSSIINKVIKNSAFL